MGFQIENGVLKEYIKEMGETDVVIPDGVTTVGGGFPFLQQSEEHRHSERCDSYWKLRILWMKQPDKYFSF